jgi:hypothetical protein
MMHSCVQHGHRVAPALTLVRAGRKNFDSGNAQGSGSSSRPRLGQQLPCFQWHRVARLNGERALEARWHADEWRQ